jgi:chloramphenicol O-acetyltransferase type A
MKQEINPKDSSRAQAFELWMQSPMPMVTLTKTFDVTRIHNISKQKGYKFNMLLCWCIGRAASRIEEFYTLPEQGRLYRYDRLAINVIVNNCAGGINSCDIPYTDDIKQFNNAYTTLTQQAASTCESISEEDAMVIGTSAMTATELDSIVNQYTDLFCNPMVMWGRYRKGITRIGNKHWGGLFKTTLPISFQFHHVQMDGGHASQFLEELQKTIHTIR